MPVKFYLFTRPDKLGDHPINVSISLFGERLCTSIGYGISPSKWDEASQRVKKNAYNSKKVAYNLINSMLNLIHGHFERLEAIEKKLTKDEIRSELATLIKRKEKVSKTGRNAGLFDHYDEFVKDGITNKRWAQNTIKKWTTVRHHLKEFNEPITIIQYLNGTRHEFTYPKWQVVSTHTGRKSFICNALAAGIPVHVVMKWTGHSDYKAMKPYIEVAEKTKAAAMDQFTNMFE